MNAIGLAQPRSWATVRRLLAVRLDNLGDLLMTSPALSAIRHSLPNVHLSVLTSPAAAALAPHVPAIDEVIPFEHGTRVFAAAPEPKEFVELDSGHADAYLAARATYYGSIDAFIKRVVGQQPVVAATSR